MLNDTNVRVSSRPAPSSRSAAAPPSTTTPTISAEEVSALEARVAAFEADNGRLAAQVGTLTAALADAKDESKEAVSAPAAAPTAPAAELDDDESESRVARLEAQVKRLTASKQKVSPGATLPRWVHRVCLSGASNDVSLADSLSAFALAVTAVPGGGRRGRCQARAAVGVAGGATDDQQG